MLTSLSDSLGNIIDKIPNGSSKDTYKVCQAWAKIADKLAFEHTDMVMWSKAKRDSRHKVLIIYFDNSVVAAGVNMKRACYKRAVEHELGENFDEIRFIVSKRKPIQPFHAIYSQS